MLISVFVFVVFVFVLDNCANLCICRGNLLISHCHPLFIGSSNTISCSASEMECWSLLGINEAIYWIATVPNSIPPNCSTPLEKTSVVQNCASVLLQYIALGAIYAVSLYGWVFCSERVLVLARNILAARARLLLFGTTLAQASPPPLFCPTSPNMETPLAFLITCLLCKALPLLRTTLPPPPASLTFKPIKEELTREYFFEY